MTANERGAAAFPRLLKNTLLYGVILAAGLAVGLAAARLPKLFEKPYREGDFSAYFPAAGPSVVVYGTSTCPFCAKTREYLKKKNIAFTDFNVDESEQASRQFKELKGSAVPVVLIGNRLITGFKPAAMDDAIRVVDGT